MGAGINIFKIAAAAITLMLLFPPYRCVDQNGRVMDSGYGFIFDLPVYTFTYTGSFNMVTIEIPASIDHATLIVQIIVALVVAMLLKKT